MIQYCCFCGEPIQGYGNNPYPANKEEDARCCDRCNLTIVIPKRFELINDEFQK